MQSSEERDFVHGFIANFVSIAKFVSKEYRILGAGHP
jgi:hypothetical protein